MLTIIRIESPRQLAALLTEGGIAPLGDDEFTAHAPDEHWVALAADGVPAGRCSLWWQAALALPGERPGIIGHFAARDPESAAAILAHGCRVLAERGCTVAIGPMDGTTWRRYRFVTRRGTEPPFFLEPDNPDGYPGYFEQAGFRPLARYFSNLDPDLGWSVPEALQHRLEEWGIRIRQLDPQDFSGELERIHAISTASFSNNFLYSPISLDGFLAMYGKVRSAIQPELVLFAEYAGVPVGFVFAIGDLLHPGPEKRPETVIIKSLAVLPEWNGKGVGPLLMSRATANARRLGYRRGIHALMHEDNRSRGLSGHHGDVMREYTLYSRSLL
jgi:predicted N-acetyltransferase YhbS